MMRSRATLGFGNHGAPSCSDATFSSRSRGLFTRQLWYRMRQYERWQGEESAVPLGVLETGSTKILRQAVDEMYRFRIGRRAPDDHGEVVADCLGCGMTASGSRPISIHVSRQALMRL